MIFLTALAGCGDSMPDPVLLSLSSPNPSPAALSPRVTAVQPSSGPSTGGTVVTVTGTAFAPGAVVKVGSATVQPLSVTDTQIVLVTPPHLPGTAPVTVSNPDGEFFILGQGFLYEPGPGDVLLFRNVTLSAGLDFLHVRDLDPIPVGAGVSVGDFNRDGWPDFFLTNNAGANALYINQQDGTFLDLAVPAGVALPTSDDIGACSADYDNDGGLDLYVTSLGPNHLFHNLGFGTFDEVTVFAGVGNDNRGSSCAWGDFDGDGFLDLYVTNYNVPLEGDVLPGVLYHNRGDGTFSDFTAAFDPSSIRVAGFGVTWFDYDNDGDLDLYLVNDFGSTIRPNVLLRNDGPSLSKPWAFTDVSASSGANIEQFGMGLAVGDYDGDGWLDLYATDIGRNELLRNRRDGTFEDITDTAGVGRAVHPETNFHNVGWGSLFFDYDNDGNLDLYAVAGYLDSEGIGRGQDFQPNALFHNKGDGTFTDVSTGRGPDDARVGRGGVFFDYDRDGDLDLLIANLGQSPTLLRNENDNNNSWIVLHLIGGAGSNQNALGARITVHTGPTLQIRELASGSSVHSNHTLAVHFGLASTITIDRIEIRWPSGQQQDLLNVPTRQELTIVEP